MKSFSFSTIDNFDEHINKSIRGYNILNELIIELAKYFIEENTNVYDLGCSTGTLLRELKSRYRANYIGIEKEHNFTKDLQNRKNLTFLKMDIREFKSFTNANLITSIFTLQFIPLRDREEILRNIYNGLNKGGAFIFSEKIFSKYAKINDILTFLYYDFKQTSFSSEEILNKERDLRAIMKPITLKENIKLLKKVGFKEIDIFFKIYNFTGILAIK